jgi:hypothetical protein
MLDCNLPRLFRKRRQNNARTDGEIVYPGDLLGRVIRANAVELSWGGNAMSALVGQELLVASPGSAIRFMTLCRNLRTT